MYIGADANLETFDILILVAIGYQPCQTRLQTLKSPTYSGHFLQPGSDDTQSGIHKFPDADLMSYSIHSISNRREGPCRTFFAAQLVKPVVGSVLRDAIASDDNIEIHRLSWYIVWTGPILKNLLFSSRPCCADSSETWRVWLDTPELLKNILISRFALDAI